MNLHVLIFIGFRKMTIMKFSIAMALKLPIVNEKKLPQKGGRIKPINRNKLTVQQEIVELIWHTCVML